MLFFIYRVWFWVGEVCRVILYILLSVLCILPLLIFICDIFVYTIALNVLVYFYLFISVKNIESNEGQFF